MDGLFVLLECSEDSERTSHMRSTKKLFENFWGNSEEIIYPSKHLLVQSQQYNTRKSCELCSKVTIRTPERFFTPFSSVSIVDFEQAKFQKKF